jgi:acetyltransferase-like isoleucine patch superfamily enzyme
MREVRLVRNLLGLISVLLPAPLRRLLLEKAFGFEIDRTATIGLSWVMPKEKLIMGPHSRIGHLNMIRSVDILRMEEGSLIGTLNWVTANLAGFTERELDDRVRARSSRLTLGRFASVSTRHYFDCSDEVEIGDFSDIAGLRSVLLTHHMDVQAGHQSCQPIRIGDHCFLSTNAVILGGASLPHHSVLAAGAVLVDSHTESYKLYAGCPARQKKEYEPDMGWFGRSTRSIMESRTRWSRKPGFGGGGRQP